MMFGPLILINDSPRLGHKYVNWDCQLGLSQMYLTGLYGIFENMELSKYFDLKMEN